MLRKAAWPPACLSRLAPFQYSTSCAVGGGSMYKAFFSRSRLCRFSVFFFFFSSLVYVNIAPIEKNTKGNALSWEDNTELCFLVLIKKLSSNSLQSHKKIMMQIGSKSTTHFIGSNNWPLRTEGKGKLEAKGGEKAGKRKSYLPVPQVVHLLGSLPLQSKQVWWHKWQCCLNSNFPLGHCITQRPSSKTLLKKTEA